MNYFKSIRNIFIIFVRNIYFNEVNYIIYDLNIILMFIWLIKIFFILFILEEFCFF